MVSAAVPKLTLQPLLEVVMCNCRHFFTKRVLSLSRFFQSYHRPSHTRWTVSWGTSRTVKRTTAPNAGPRQGFTVAAAAAARLCLILCLLELLLSETLAHEFGLTEASQGTSFRVTGIRGCGWWGVQTHLWEQVGCDKELH